MYMSVHTHTDVGKAYIGMLVYFSHNYEKRKALTLHKYFSIQFPSLLMNLIQWEILII